MATSSKGGSSTGENAPPLVHRKQLKSVREYCLVKSDGYFFVSDIAFSIQLPTPHLVRSRAIAAGHTVLKSHHPDPVRFPELGVFVKWGPHVTIAEAECLHFFWQTYSETRVPVPKVYGWYEDKGEIFLYMQLRYGPTLQDLWPKMEVSDRKRVCRLLHMMVTNWRNIERSTHNKELIGARKGQIGGQGLRDVMFCKAGSCPAGPFPDIKTFHDWFACFLDPTRQEDLTLRTKVPKLQHLTDAQTLTFTHNDLCQSNIIMGFDFKRESYHIVSIVGWSSHGWYPRDWEALKTLKIIPGPDDWKFSVCNFLEPPDKPYEEAWAPIANVCMGVDKRKTTLLRPRARSVAYCSPDGSSFI
ncbi:MAG: hypothetical protein M1831_001819 [Alyxoria varia]|nr:MAG: hypothetical protein M1831_001819 [Alyxoria varia]